MSSVLFDYHGEYDELSSHLTNCDVQPMWKFTTDVIKCKSSAKPQVKIHTGLLKMLSDILHCGKWGESWGEKKDGSENECCCSKFLEMYNAALKENQLQPPLCLISLHTGLTGSYFIFSPVPCSNMPTQTQTLCTCFIISTLNRSVPSARYFDRFSHVVDFSCKYDMLEQAWSGARPVTAIII